MRGFRVGLLVAALGLVSAVSGCGRNQYRESFDASPSALTALRFAPNGDPQVWIATCGLVLRRPITLIYVPPAGQGSFQGGAVSIWRLQIDASKLPPGTRSVVVSPADAADEEITMAFDPSMWSAARSIGAVTVQVGGYTNGSPDGFSSYQLSAVAAASPDFLMQDGRRKSPASLNNEARDYCAATGSSTYPP